MRAALVALVIGAFGCSSAQVTLPEAVVTAMNPGIRFEFPGPADATLIGLHYSINQEIVGVAAGQHNVDINSKTNGKWVHENKNVQVKTGDKVNYWVLAIVNGAGYQRLNLAATVGSGNAAPAATTKPTTKAPVKVTTKPTTPAQKPTTPAPKPPTKAPTAKPPSPDTDGEVVDPTNVAPQEPVKTDGGNVVIDVPQGSGGGGGGCSSCGTCDCGSKIPQTKQCSSYPCLILEDNFDTFNFDLWKHEITAGGGGNWEFQYYTNNRTNSYVEDGNLYIKPTLTSDKYGEAFLTSGMLDIWGNGPSACTGNAFYGCFRQGTGSNLVNPLQSARLRTWETFALKYGKVEVEAKMPAGDWIWPAIWLLPKNEEYGIWPASGEIDIVEARGNADLRDPSGKRLGVDSMGSTLHWGPYWPVNGWEKTHVTKTAEDGTFASDFHKYAVEWDEEHISFFLDDEEILTVDPEQEGHDGFWSFGEFEDKVPGSTNPWVGSSSKMAPFDKEFYIILNVAVGGTNGFFGDDWINGAGAKPWRNTSPTAFLEFWNGRNQWLPTWKEGETAMVVNYVKVWKMKPDA